MLQLSLPFSPPPLSRRRALSLQYKILRGQGAEQVKELDSLGVGLDQAEKLRAGLSTS